MPCPSFPWLFGFPWLIFSKEFPCWAFSLVLPGFLCVWWGKKILGKCFKFSLAKTQQPRKRRTRCCILLLNTSREEKNAPNLSCVMVPNIFMQRAFTGERKKPINIKNFGGTPPGVRPVCPGDTSHLSRDMSRLSRGHSVPLVLIHT